MKPSELIMDPIDLQRFTRHARSGVLMSLVGALIVVGSIAYSGFKLASLEVTVKSQEKELAAARTELSRVRRDKESIERQLDDLRARLKSARSSFYLTQLAAKRFFRRDYRGAVEYYDQAIKIDAANPVLFDLKGYALFRANRLDEAVISLETAIKIDPEYIWGHYNLSLAYWATGRPAQAIEEVRKVTRIDPSFRTVIRGDGQFDRFKTSQSFRQLLDDG